MVASLVGIIFPLRDVLAEVGIGRGDGVIVAGAAIALEHVPHDLLAIDGVLHRQPEIRVVGGLAVDHHRQVDECAALRPDQIHLLALLDQTHSLRVQLQHHIDVAREQSVHPRGNVADTDDFDLVHPGSVRPPVVVVALEDVTRTRLPVLDLERAGADRGGDEILVAVPTDLRPRIGQDNGEVGVRRGQPESDHVVAVLLHLRDLTRKCLGGRLGIFAVMPVERVDHVVCGERRAVMPFHVLAKLEDPFAGVRSGFPGLRQPRNRLQVRASIYETVVYGEAHEDVGGRVVLRRIQRIPGLGRLDPDRDLAALLRLGGVSGAGQQCRYGSGGDAKGAHAADELAPGEQAAVQRLQECFSCRHGASPRMVFSFGLMHCGSRTSRAWSLTIVCAIVGSVASPGAAGDRAAAAKPVYADRSRAGQCVRATARKDHRVLVGRWK